MAAAIVVDNVSKKFLIGSARYSSLRDVIARPVRRLFGRAAQSETERTREFWALKDVSFEVEKGTTLGIIGPNGAGKSTLLKLMSRVSMPTKGRITTHGRVSALIEVGAGFHPELTGRENVYLNGSILGMTRAEIKCKFDTIVDFSGLEQFIDTPVKHYSSGMYVRLGFSIAVSAEPEILLVDEVLSVGDFVFQRKCREAMDRYKRSGTTIVLVSHNLEQVADLCGRTILLGYGKVCADAATQNAIAQYYQAYASGRMLSQDGQKVAVIESVAIRDSGGHDVAEVVPGQNVAVNVIVRCLGDVAQPALGLFIRKNGRDRIFDTTSYRLGHELASMTCGQVVSGVFNLKMNLAPGSYTLGCHIERQEGGSFYDYVDIATKFIVAGKTVSSGAGFLAPAFKLDGAA